MEETELLEILTSLSDDFENFRQETQARLNAEISILRKTVNAMLPHIPATARSHLATEFRDIIAQEAQGPGTTLPRTMSILAMPNALMPLYPRFEAEQRELVAHLDVRRERRD